MTDPLPDGNGAAVHHLPPPKQPYRQPHVFGAEVMIPPDKSDSGYEQKELACKNCGAVRVTVLGSVLSGRVWRGWRRAAGAPLVETDVAPPCPAPLAVTP